MLISKKDHHQKSGGTNTHSIGLDEGRGVLGATPPTSTVELVLMREEYSAFVEILRYMYTSVCEITTENVQHIF